MIQWPIEYKPFATAVKDAVKCVFDCCVRAYIRIGCVCLWIDWFLCVQCKSEINK